MNKEENDQNPDKPTPSWFSISAKAALQAQESEYVAVGMVD